MSTDGEIVARVVCDRCGDAEIGWVTKGEWRGRAVFWYEPVWTPDDLDQRDRPWRIVWRDDWPVEGPVEPRSIDVACRRHGWMTFEVSDAVPLARKGRPYARSTIRARQHNVR